LNTEMKERWVEPENSEGNDSILPLLEEIPILGDIDARVYGGE
jgi:hypothetical protein